MELQLIEGFQHPKAKLDPIFQMKAEIVRVCSRIHQTQRYSPSLVGVWKNHIAIAYSKAHVSATWNRFLDTRRFDALIVSMLDSESRVIKGEYSHFRFNSQLLDRLNSVKNKPELLSPPFYYDSAGQVRSLFTRGFYGRVEQDCFGHPTIIINENNTDKYFAIFNQKAAYEYYPQYIQPFLAARGIEKHFLPHGTNFKSAFKIVRGLFTIWYGTKW